jgi:hypothetical protein
MAKRPVMLPGSPNWPADADTPRAPAKKARRRTLMATLMHDALGVSMSGLAKIYRGCGYQVGWSVFSGDSEPAAGFMHALELLASLSLCANVPGHFSDIRHPGLDPADPGGDPGAVLRLPDPVARDRRIAPNCPRSIPRSTNMPTFVPRISGGQV